MTDERNNNDRRRAAEPYDERQKQIRTKCFAHAFFVMPVLLFFNIALLDSGVPWFDPTFSWLASVILAVTLAAMEMIWREAWIPPGGSYSAWWSVASAVLLIIALAAKVADIFRNEVRWGIVPVENGILASDWLYILTLGCMALIELWYLLRLLVSRLKDSNGEEP